MASARARFSILSQPLDRAALVAYFLGGIVPLAALVWMVQRYAGAELRRPAVAGLLGSLTLLSLASFLLLQRVTRQALARAEADNRRLQKLVVASGTLAQSADRDQVIDLATRTAGSLFGADEVLFLQLGPGGTFTLSGTAGAGAHDLYLHDTEQVEELAALAVPEGDAAAELIHGGLAALPATAVGVGAGGLFEGALIIVQPSTPLHEPGAAGALKTLARLVTVALRNCDLRADQRNFFTHATNLLVRALDSHLDYQSEHSRRVAHLSNRLARCLAMDEERLHTLHFAALLHDIGMLTLDRESMAASRAAVERHPELGAEMLRPIHLWSHLAPVVRHHHEWFDGSGYPDGLRGDAIPLESRVIAVAEAFDSMTSEHSYRASIPAPEALARIGQGAGSQFDPRVVQALDRLATEGELARIV
jgi:putative nucleotidyltransferase with HDIG domain